MKKVFLSLAVLASVAMVSCSKSNNGEAEATNDSTVVEDSCVNTCCDSVVATDSVVADTTVVAE